MNEARLLPVDELLECSICLKEVPVSEAKSDEASDYVFHFCGIDCYQQWRELENQQQ